METVKLLIAEVIQLAKVKNIEIPEDIMEKTLTKLKSLPYEITSSMHDDFKNKKSKNELQNLTGYVIKESENHNIMTPNYSKMYANLKKRSNL